MRGSAVGFPLSRSLEIKNTDKTNVEKLFDSSSSSLATNNLSSPEVSVADPNNRKGPLTIAAAGTYSTGKPNSEGRFVVTGSSSWAANRFLGFNGNGDLALNAVNWLGSDEDLISIRPKPQEDRRITMTRAQLNLVAGYQPIRAAIDGGDRGNAGLVEEKIRAAPYEFPRSDRRSYCSRHAGRRSLLVAAP